METRRTLGHLIPLINGGIHICVGAIPNFIITLKSMAILLMGVIIDLIIIKDDMRRMQDLTA